MRVLFTTNPLVGHWLPMLPLARAAVAGGHEVVVAAGPDLVPDIERRGLAAWSVGPDLKTIQEGVRHRARTTDETADESTVRDGMAMFAAPAVDRVLDLRRLTHQWRPDLVVREAYELAGAYVPSRLQVLHGFGAHFPGIVGLTELALRELSGVLGPPLWHRSVSGTAYLDPFPPALQPPDDQPFTDVLHLRPDAGEVRPDDALPAAVTRLPYDRTVYLTLGTLFNDPGDFAVPLNALDGLEVNVVVTTGRGVDPSTLAAPPAHVVVEEYVPQALLLPRCSAVICHAGAGTVLGALAHGLPLVCLPRGADQFSNAAQVARAGAGVTLLPDAVDTRSLAAAVQRVLDEPAYAAAARRLQRDIAALPDPASAMDELQDRLRRS